MARVGGRGWDSEAPAEMLVVLVARGFSFLEEGLLELLEVVGLISVAMVVAMWGVVLVVKERMGMWDGVYLQRYSITLYFQRDMHMSLLHMCEERPRQA